jgi:16S rRNA pseudouridine516 synthase
MKLSRIISNQNGISRKQANALIARGCVAVDGLKCQEAAREVSTFEQVTCEGRVVQAAVTAHYLMMNQPAGILSATRDAAHRTVIDLIHPAFENLHIAGRLDRASTGLLILTNDGIWSRRLTEPSLKKPKIYRVTTAQPITPETAGHFADGVWFDHEQLRTSPAGLKILADDLARVTIFEGRYHQIKRMFHAVGNRVTALHRETMGDITLDPELPAGGWRLLTADEISSVTDKASAVRFR